MQGAGQCAFVLTCCFSEDELCLNGWVEEICAFRLWNYTGRRVRSDDIIILLHYGIRNVRLSFAVQMKKSLFSVWLTCLLALTVWSGAASAQCTVVINEIMINGPGPCDGACNPNTEEWVELHNTCTSPIDISCWKMGDGDFTVTFPSGTVIPAGGYFVIGSINSGPVVDLFLGSCNCTSGTMVGTFTNPNEQVLLFDSAGVLQDAIYWGAGQFPCTVNAPSMFGCAPLSFVVNTPGPEFELLPGGGANGCTMARVCDGVMLWEQRCSDGITMGAPNASQPVLAITVEDDEICAGTCTNVIYSGTGPAISYSWQFPGSNIPSFVGDVPPSLCYGSPGNYDVFLELTSLCGVYSQTFSNAIQVLGLPVPVIDGDKVVELCGDEGIVLTTQSGGSLQWLLGDDPIEGETGLSLNVDTPGSYSVMVTLGDCSAISNEIQVFEGSLVAPDISPGPLVEICPGESVELAVPDAFESYQWLFNGQPIVGAQGSEFTAATPGLYSILVGFGGCTTTSPPVTLQAVQSLTLTIFPEGGAAICDGETIVLSTNPGLTDYVWYLDGKPVLGEMSNEITVTAGGTYIVEAAQGTCEASSPSYFLTVFGSPFIFYDGPLNLLICESGAEEVFVGVDTETVQWYFNGAIIPGGTQADIVVSSAGTYMLEASFEDGCSSTLTLNVSVADPVVALILSSTGSFDLCAGEVTTLSVEGTWSSYEWMFNNFPISGNPTIPATISGLYTVTVFNEQGCSATDVVAISTQTVVQPTISPGGTIDLCFGETIQLTSDEPIEQWLLNGVEIPDSNTQEWLASEPGVYTAVSGFGDCALTSNSVVVTVGEPIDVTISQSEEAPCEGETIELTATGSGFDALIWSTGTIGSSITVSQSGNYSVTAVNVQLCSIDETQVVSFIPLPMANAGPDVFNVCGSGTLIAAQVSGGLISWFPDEGLDNPTIAQPFANPLETTTYVLTVSIGDCVSSDEVTVISDCSSLTVPNVFTPNGDGTNDLLELLAAGVVEFELRIYNRWGQLVFESTSPEKQWDGRTNGEELPSGTYYYTLRAIDFTGRDIVAPGQSSGHITLLR